jgi:hypothetical protein
MNINAKGNPRQYANMKNNTAGRFFFQVGDLAIEYDPSGCLKQLNGSKTVETKNV